MTSQFSTIDVNNFDFNNPEAGLAHLFGNNTAGASNFNLNTLLENEDSNFRICCMAQTASCLACQEDITVEEFCLAPEGKNLTDCAPFQPDC